MVGGFESWRDWLVFRLGMIEGRVEEWLGVMSACMIRWP